MRAALALLLVAAAVSFSSARDLRESGHRQEASLTDGNSSGEPQVPANSRLEDDPRFTRVHIKNRTSGFDGKVDRIHITPGGEDNPGVRAYGLPKKHLENSGLIERVHLPNGQRYNEDTRSGRLVEAYGMQKKHVDDNGEIERLAPPPAFLRNENANQDRRSRGRREVEEAEGPEEEQPLQGENQDVDAESNNELDDLEAQDAKVFRPLFVYRQQMAKRQGRYRNHYNSLHHRDH